MSKVPSQGTSVPLYLCGQNMRRAKEAEAYYVCSNLWQGKSKAIWYRICSPILKDFRISIIFQGLARQSHLKGKTLDPGDVFHVGWLG